MKLEKKSLRTVSIASISWILPKTSEVELISLRYFSKVGIELLRLPFLSTATVYSDRFCLISSEYLSRL